jgi:hypothetical protein
VRQPRLTPGKPQKCKAPDLHSRTGASFVAGARNCLYLLLFAGGLVGRFR